MKNMIYVQHEEPAGTAAVHTGQNIKMKREVKPHCVLTSNIKMVLCFHHVTHTQTHTQIPRYFRAVMDH